MDADLLKSPLAADPARGGGVEATLARIADERAGTLDHVRGQVRGGARLTPVFDQALAVEEAQGQLLVVARGSHRHRHGAAVDTDLKRLLDRNLVGDAVVLDGRQHARVTRLAHRTNLAPGCFASPSADRPPRSGRAGSRSGSASSGRTTTARSSARRGRTAT